MKFKNRIFYQALSVAYNNLSQAYSKVVQAMASRKRLLGTYFRVAFFGEVSPLGISARTNKCMILVLNLVNIP